MGRCAGTRSGTTDERGMTLIELLIGMTIMTVLTTMILMGWFSLSRSYSFTVASSDARDSGRQALSRMAREIRDAETNPSAAETSIVRARARWIEFYTTFNLAGSSSATTAPRLVLYRLYPNGQLWRFQSQPGETAIANVSLNDNGWPSSNNFALDERLNGEGAMLMVDHAVNDSVPSSSSRTALFEYEQYGASGNVTLSPTVTGTASRAGIVAVQIHLLVDLNPSRAPVYADFQTTAQLRNNR
jgi:prepilin-type N-terminal cleavage/methylation domain-containing protein